jgi:transcriptional regulator with XRE-family HTH domain
MTPWVLSRGFMKILGERIKILRKSKNLLQRELAEILSIANDTMIRFESGVRRPSLDNLIILADYFDVSMDYLIGRSDDPKRR